MTTLTLNSVDYEVYSSLAEVDDYFNGSNDFCTWDGYDDSEKMRAIISATRLLERQTWQGSRTVSTQALSFPRTGLTDRDGVSVDDDETPADIIEACQLLAYEILGGSTVESTNSTESREKKVKAGSVEVEYFRSNRGSRTRFPLAVQELINPFLASSVAISLSNSYGTDTDSLDDDIDFSGGF